MYAVIIQDEHLVVKNIYRCRNMVEVQEVLEELEPSMDSEYLVSGEASTLTFYNKTYSVRKLESVENLVKFKSESY